MKEENICPRCSFPRDLCICGSLEAEEQEIIIKNGRRKWGKVVSLVRFKGENDISLEDLLTKAKKKCASGGTIRGKNTIEIRGDHRFKLRKMLVEMGFPKENIRIF